MDIHRLIHSNLQQLDMFSSISFPFTEGMFKVTNIKGFQGIMHYLLNILDPEKCAKLIPWPLLDKKTESQYRIGVRTFLMEINEKHPEANLPKIFPSLFMAPGGEKFAHLMWKLTMFVLQMCLRNKYGDESMLLPPRTYKNDPHAAAYLNLLQRLISSETQKALAYQKIETESKCEWQCNLELAKLDEEAREREIRLKEVVASCSISPSIKEKLLDFKNNSSAISEWTQEVERESREVEAIHHVLSRHRRSLENICSAVSISMKEASQSCSESNNFLSPDQAEDQDVKKLLQDVEIGKVSFSDFLIQLSAAQDSPFSINSPAALRNMAVLASELDSIKDDFSEVRNSSAEITKQLTEKLDASQKSLQEILNGSPEKGTETKELSPPIPDIDKYDEACGLMFTPVRGVYKEILKKKPERVSIGGLDIDTKLLLTPEIERSFHTPPMSMKKQLLTPESFSVTKSTSTNSDVGGLRSLTRSLIWKRKCQQMPYQIQSSDKDKRTATEPILRVNKELLYFSTGKDTKTRLGSLIPKRCLATPHTPLERVVESTANLHESVFSDALLESSNNEEESGIFSSQIEDNDITTSPSLFLSSITSSETKSSNSKVNRRKSLDAIIQRYLKVREKMNMHE